MNGSIYDMRNTHYVIFATPKEQSTIVLGVANKMETGWFGFQNYVIGVAHIMNL